MRRASEAREISDRDLDPVMSLGARAAHPRIR